MGVLDFAEFSPASTEDWNKYASKELKNVTAESLNWLSYENIEWQPYYDKNSLSGLPIEEIQHAQKNDTSWKSIVTILYTSEKDTNKQLNEVVQNGAEAIEIDFSGVESIATINFSLLLSNLKLSDTPIFFKTNETDVLLTTLASVAPYKLKGGVLLTDLFYQLIEGKKDSEHLGLIFDANFGNFKSYLLSTSDVHFRGGNVVQENAVLLSKLVKCVNGIADDKAKIEIFLNQLLIEVSSNPNYFLAIAQLRAIRYLLATVLQAYGITQLPSIQSTTSAFYHTGKSPYSNILRTTTQAMSAAIGGCDFLKILPYDYVAENTSELASRIARNITIILKEESYLTANSDSASGAYFIEWLTYQLIENSWELFLKIESNGGIESALQDGWLLNEIEEVNARRIADYKAGKIMVGVNKFTVTGDEIEAEPVVDKRIEELILAN